MSKQQYRYQVSTFKAQQSLGYLLKRAHSLMLDILEPVLEARGFTLIQYVILLSLRDGLAVNPKDICSQFRHDSGALTRVIDQLAERGLLERVRSHRDRRTVELQLTPAGLVAVEGLVPFVVDKLNLALEGLTGTEASELLRLLAKLNDRLQTIVETPVAVAAS